MLNPQRLRNIIQGEKKTTLYIGRPDAFMLHENNEGESVGAAECLILSRFTHQHRNLLLGILACLIYQGHIVWLYWWVVSSQNIISTCEQKVGLKVWILTSQLWPNMTNGRRKREDIWSSLSALSHTLLNKKPVVFTLAAMWIQVRAVENVPLLHSVPCKHGENIKNVCIVKTHFRTLRSRCSKKQTVRDRQQPHRNINRLFCLLWLTWQTAFCCLGKPVDWHWFNSPMPTHVCF